MRAGGLGGDEGSAAMKWGEVGHSLKFKLSLLITADRAPNLAGWAREALEATRAR